LLQRTSCEGKISYLIFLFWGTFGFALESNKQVYYMMQCLHLSVMFAAQPIQAATQMAAQFACARQYQATKQAVLSGTAGDAATKAGFTMKYRYAHPTHKWSVVVAPYYCAVTAACCSTFSIVSGVLMNFLHGGLTYNVDVMVDEVLRRHVCLKPKSRPGRELLDIAGWAVSHLLLALNSFMLEEEGGSDRGPWSRDWSPGESSSRAKGSGSGEVSVHGELTFCHPLGSLNSDFDSAPAEAALTAARAAPGYFTLFGTAQATNSTALFSSTLRCLARTRVGNLVVMRTGDQCLCCRVDCYAVDAGGTGYVVGEHLEVLSQEHGYLVVSSNGEVRAFPCWPAVVLEHCASTHHKHRPEGNLVLMPTDSLPFWLLDKKFVAKFFEQHAAQTAQ
jgi:hypothetical protein